MKKTIFFQIRKYSKIAGKCDFCAHGHQNVIAPNVIDLPHLWVKPMFTIVNKGIHVEN